jgi:hypothetical protein
MTFGYKDIIKGYSDEYFEHNKNTGFHRPFEGYVPIRVIFNVTARQVYLRSIEFGHYETENASYAPLPVLHRKNYRMDPFKIAHTDLYQGFANVYYNRRDKGLVDKAMYIVSRGGMKWFKRSNRRNIDNKHDQFTWVAFTNNMDYSTIRNHAINETMSEIQNSRRASTVSQKGIQNVASKMKKMSEIQDTARRQKQKLTGHLKYLPPIRTSTGRLVYPGGKRSRDSLRRVEKITDSPLPENLTQLWKKLKIDDTPAKKQTKKRRTTPSTSRNSKRSK